MEDRPDKRQRITVSSNSSSTSPIVHLNIGGIHRTTRRSLLNKLRDASSSNPLCDVLLNEHWSNNSDTSVATSTVVDLDGITRIYLDRDVEAFDDLLCYIEYGLEFLRDICKDRGSGFRLHRLRCECDFFTVASFVCDVESILPRQDVSFSVRDYVKISAKGKRDEDDVVTSWAWSSFTGNEALLTKKTEGLGMAQVQSSGMYLVFFSLHSVAVTALPPDHGYKSEDNDELCTLSVFRDAMTQTAWNEWTYPLLRCGAFDYRTDIESRGDNPYIITAAAAELISLQEGNVIYCKHGHGVVDPDRSRRTITGFVREYSIDREDYEPEAVTHMTYVKVLAKNVAKFFVVMEDASDETTIVEWKSCNIGASNTDTNHTAVVSLGNNDATKICFNKSGHYIIIGRIAGCLKKSFHKNNEEDEHRPAIHLDIYDSFEMPLQILPEIVSFSDDRRSEPYNNKMAEYGHMNDVIYVKDNSYLTVRGSHGACFAKHGTLPLIFNKMATQSLTVMRLDRLVCLDRYVVSTDNNWNGRITLKRALGESKDRDSMFTVENDDDSENKVLKAKRAFQCIVLCSVSSLLGSNVALMKNDESIIHSQLCENSGCGSNCLNGVLDLDADDCVKLSLRDHLHNPPIGFSSGHMAFIQLTN